MNNLMDIMEAFDMGVNIFSMHPQLRILYKELIDEHKEDVASEILWALLLMLHPGSMLNTYDEEDKLNFIRSSYPNLKDFNPEDYEKEIEITKKAVLTKAEQYLMSWQRKLDEREQFIDSVPYNESTYEMLDKIMGNSTKMWDQYNKCLKDVQKEREMGHTRGGAVESLQERGEI